MEHSPDRRIALLGLGVAAGAAALGSTSATAAKASGAWMPQGATTLTALHAKLDAAPRRRDFKTLPMTLDNQAYSEHHPPQIAGPRRVVLCLPQTDLGTIRHFDPERLKSRQTFARGDGRRTHQPSHSRRGAHSRCRGDAPALPGGRIPLCDVAESTRL